MQQPEHKERKAPSNRDTLNVMQHLMFVVFFRNMDIVIFVEKMCGATFWNLSNFLNHFWATFKDFLSIICLSLFAKENLKYFEW